MFELNIIQNELEADFDGNPVRHPGVTLNQLDDRLDIPRETLREDLDALVDRDVFRQNSEDPAYQSKGFQMLDTKVDLPCGETVGYLSPRTFGVVGHAYLNDDLTQFIDQHGYQEVDEVAKFSASDNEDVLLAHLYPEIPDEDLDALPPAVEYAHNRLVDDPLWGQDLEK